MLYIANRSTPAAVAVEACPAPKSLVWQFVVLRGVPGVRFATQLIPGGSWSALSSIERPERFGDPGETFASLRAWVERFFA